MDVKVLEPTGLREVKLFDFEAMGIFTLDVEAIGGDSARAECRTDIL